MGGSLAAQWEASFARYLAKFVQAYEAAGCRSSASRCRTSRCTRRTIRRCRCRPTQQARIIANHLGPRFAADGIAAKIVAYDHNWDNTAYPLQVLNDPARDRMSPARRFMRMPATSRPSQPCTTPTRTRTFISPRSPAATGQRISATISSGTRRTSSLAARATGRRRRSLWNLALESERQSASGRLQRLPRRGHDQQHDRRVTFNEEFYVLGQVTTAIQPDAVRIGSNDQRRHNTVAFLNPDGSRVLMALNPNPLPRRCGCTKTASTSCIRSPASRSRRSCGMTAAADFDNGGFDQEDFSKAADRSTHGPSSATPTATSRPAAEAVLGGDKSLKLYGQFNGS